MLEQIMGRWKLMFGFTRQLWPDPAEIYEITAFCTLIPYAKRFTLILSVFYTIKKQRNFL
ncbi:hypothetical protein [Paenibacillus odorifer]|uniref:hypothetical protein n=1 Tax=Paenibacillus odorifer TaxID=189426 RepID=UPI0014838C7D|nr:hypothetical protein [Paenibacillus odorifer]